MVDLEQAVRKLGPAAAVATLPLPFVFLFGPSARADGPPSGVDAAQRGDVVTEDAGNSISATEGGIPDVDTAQRDDVVPAPTNSPAPD